jgi:hypothetical protein
MMAEKNGNASNGTKTPRPEIKRGDTDKQFDDYFVRSSRSTVDRTYSHLNLR